MRFALPKRKVRFLFYSLLLAVAYITFLLIPKAKNEKIRYHFKPQGALRYTINEQGTIIFPSKKEMKLYNDYKADITFTTINKELSLKTTLTGSFDPLLEILHPNYDFLTTMNRGHDGCEFCPNTISPIYPFSLRRLIYILPTGLKPNQHIRKRICSDYDCLWKSEEVVDTLHVSLHCEATTSNHFSVVFSTHFIFSQQQNTYTSMHGVISVESPDISSVWEFSERLDRKEKKEERKINNDSKIHSN